MLLVSRYALKRRPYPGQRYRHGWILLGQAALDAVPAKLTPGPRGHFGDYEGQHLDGPPGSGSVQALSEYEGVEYQTTNSYLRSGPYDLSQLRDDNPIVPGDPTTTSRASMRAREEATAERIAEIDKTMAVSRLTGDVEVQRGIKSGKDLFGAAWHEGVMNAATTDFDEQDREYDRWMAGERPDLTGLRFRDRGYVSTTADPFVAEQFVASRAKWKLESPDGEGEPIVLTIRVPAGVGAVQLGTLAAAGTKHGRLDSAEILLEHGLAFEITADHGVDEGGFRRLDAKVVFDE